MSDHTQVSDGVYSEEIDAIDTRQFYLAARRLADHLLFGTDRSPFLGSGIEYVQSRPYQFGDPIKSIDWRVTARAGKLFVKEYEATKQLPVYLLLDTSASMTVRSGKKSKYACACQLAGGLALLALSRVSPVSLIGVGGRELYYPPSLSQEQIMIWLTELRRYRIDEPTRLAKKAADLGRQLTARAIVIVLSDLQDPQSATMIKRLAHRHEVLVIRLVDPAEQPLKGVRFVRGREAESQRTFLMVGMPEQHNLLPTDRELVRAGIDCLALDISQPIVGKLKQFLARRGQLKRGPR